MTVCSSTQRKKRKMTHKIKLQKLSDHDEFLNRITKTLYYGKIPLTDRFSLPVSELAAELFSEVKKGCSLDQLHIDEAAQISRNACVSPCSLVLALLYLERLKTCNSEYVDSVAPSELFLVSMMVASKFLHDDGEEDEVFNDEWATSGGIDLKDMNRLEREFLNAMNWEVYVSEQTFWTRLREMEAGLALREGKKRGWFSYTELSQLVKAVELASLAHTLITVSAVCLTSYTASVLAMVGSTIVINQLPSVASSLVSSSSHLLPAAFKSPAPAPPALPAAPPASCMPNDTIPDEAPLTWQHWPSLLRALEEGIGNHSSEGTNKLTHLNSYRMNDKWEDDRKKQDSDWLAMISAFVKVATTTTSPGMAGLMPAEILTY